MSRSCGSCTACCRGALAVAELGIDRGKPCAHVSHKGCAVHDHQPAKICGEFQCGWTLRPDLFPHWMRPDKSGVIVKLNDYFWCDVPADTVVAIRSVVPKKTRVFFDSMLAKHHRFHVYEIPKKDDGPTEFKVIPIGPDLFVQDVFDRI